MSVIPKQVELAIVYQCYLSLVRMHENLATLALLLCTYSTCSIVHVSCSYVYGSYIVSKTHLLLKIYNCTLSIAMGDSKKYRHVCKYLPCMYIHARQVCLCILPSFIQIKFIILT